MEEQEAPLEEVHENIHEHAEHARERWIPAVALTTAVLAAVAAIASLLSGDRVNEAMLEQIQASGKWNYYQAVGIKSAELSTRLAVLEANGKSQPDAEKKISEYGDKREHLAEEAREIESESARHMRQHHVIAKSVTFSQIAIAICAISVLTRQKWFWGLGILFGCIGTAFLIWGVLRV